MRASLKSFSIILLVLIFVKTQAQVTTEPAFPTADQPVKIIYDASQGSSSLVGVSRVFMHSGAILSSPSGTDWQNVQGQWGNPSSVGEMTSVPGQPNKWQITITPRSYFGVAMGVTIHRIGMVFREAGPCGGFAGNNTACKEGKNNSNQDIFVNLFAAGLQLVFSQPTQSAFFVNQNETVNVTIQSSRPANLSISVNGMTVAAQNGVSALSTSITASSLIRYNVTANASDGMDNASASFYFLVRKNTLAQSRPAGVKPGINYSADPTKVTLCLQAPGKNYVYLIGDFNNWEADHPYQMKKDGEFFWLELTGLMAKKEYIYQYLVDEVTEVLRVADPYCDKVSDPDDDKFIPSSTYPDLIAYPAGKTTGMASVFQTDQTPYTWTVNNFTRPAKTDLVVYEALMRDFLFTKNFKSIIDTLNYLKNLGVNAIELMPINEFDGNLSWGYNPNYYFAVDKFYGTKNDFKKFVDECHQRGMAVILDVVYNHAHETSPFAALYWDKAAFKPSNDNPWLNRDAKHPFNVFFDFNHESTYTQAFLDSVLRYWISEYKIDGYRFDLSKGFTQTFNTDVGLWSAYDQSRINILTRMANQLWNFDPTAYVILEHLGVNSEETVLANTGMMLWGNMTSNYSQNAMGYAQNSDIAWTYHGTRGWNHPGVVAYMESHDEERMVYKNQQFGNASGNYDTKLLNTALDRAKAAATFFYTIPGPKMLWQFGELGYDFSINHCTNGTVNNNCRLDQKPIRWDYFNNLNRKKLYQTTAQLIKLKTTYPVFKTTDVTISGGNTLLKQIILRAAPFTTTPANANQMSVVIIGNFGVSPDQITANFPHTGNWYHYFNGGATLNVTSLSTSLMLAPGEFRIYTNVRLPDTETELMPFVKPNLPTTLNANGISDLEVSLQWNDASDIEAGFRILRSTSAGGPFTQVGSVGANVSSFVDRNNLTAQNTYYYKLVAFNDFGSGESTVASGTTTGVLPAPAAPVNLTAIPSMNAIPQVTLNWNDLSNNETAFLIERSTTAGGPFVQVGVVESNVTNYSDMTVNLGATYFYRVASARGSSKTYSNEAASGVVVVEKTLKNAYLKIYPNPFVQYLTLEWAELLAGEITYEISDLQGRNVYQHTQSIGNEKTEILLPNLRPGMYLLRIRSKEGELVKKIAKY